MPTTLSVNTEEARSWQLTAWWWISAHFHFFFYSVKTDIIRGQATMQLGVSGCCCHPVSSVRTIRMLPVDKKVSIQGEGRRAKSKRYKRKWRKQNKGFEDMYQGKAGGNKLTSLISNQRNPNLSLTWRVKGREEWVRKWGRGRARRNKRSRCKKWNDKRRREIRLKQISVLNKQSEETPRTFSSALQSLGGGRAGQRQSWTGVRNL